MKGEKFQDNNVKEPENIGSEMQEQIINFNR
jgi:hypothetical protein